jgi:hypothetical protein
MPTPSSTGLAMRRDGIPTESQRGREAVGHGVARKPPKRAKSPSEKRAEDKRAAPWFDAGVAAYEKADAYAEAAKVDKGDLSKMRTGEIAVSLRRCLPMQEHGPSAIAFVRSFLAPVKLAECPHEVLELAAELLDEIGYVPRPKGSITPAQVGAIAVRLLSDGRASREMLERECYREHGATPADVAMALRNQEDNDK